VLRRFYAAPHPVPLWRQIYVDDTTGRVFVAGFGSLLDASGREFVTPYGARETIVWIELGEINSYVASLGAQGYSEDV
jgi:hypothetical protein